jgi:acyl carrier protein
MAGIPFTQSDILKRIAEILHESFDVDPATVHPRAHLIDDLDLDSIDAIDLAVRLEEETGFNIDEKELREIRVVQDVVDLILGKEGPS